MVHELILAMAIYSALDAVAHSELGPVQQLVVHLLPVGGISPSHCHVIATDVAPYATAWLKVSIWGGN